MDEVLRTDQVVILHKGVVHFNGGVPQLLSQTGTTSVREAFRAVTGTKAPVEEAA
jgi:ABC-2 type transport system ATP-binding protein